MDMEESECGCVIEDGSFHFMCDQHATPTVKKVMAHAHAAGRREAWDRFGGNVDEGGGGNCMHWTDEGHICFLQPKVDEDRYHRCTYDTCPLLKDGETGE